MVNSESHSIENSIEKAKENVKKLGILKVIGKSMLGKLKHGAKVAFEIKQKGDQFNIGDIIVFNRDGVNIVHEIVSAYSDLNGELSYITKGVNNQYIDSKSVSPDQVLGKVVDLTKQELAGLLELVKDGRIPYIKALGISNILDSIISFDSNDHKFENVYEGFGSDNMKQLTFNGELGPEEIRVAILKNLIDADMVEILKRENPTEYGDLQPNQYDKILEALGINKEIHYLTDSDIMDIARKRFQWGEYKDGNVAYNIYKIKYKNGEIETGVDFAWSKSQDLPSEIEIANGKVIVIDDDLYASKKGNLGYYDSERKLIIAFLDKINSKNVESIELLFASERGYCSFCTRNIQNLLRILSSDMKIPEIQFDTRNESGSPINYENTGVRFFNQFFFKI